MAMTRQEMLAKNQISDILGKEGYPTYARLFDYFELNLTSDPSVIAYMEPGRGRIVVNKTLNIEQVSMVIRHEILHEYLDHEKRLLRDLAKQRNLNYNDLDDMSLNELKNELYGDSNFNIAGDYEISNRGYTNKDKNTARSLEVNGEIVSGLVTEDDHPDWVDLPIEDMYKKLKQEMKNQPKPNNNGMQQGNSQSNNNQSASQQADDDTQGNNSSNKPTIGSKGNKDIQDAEQAEREANNENPESDEEREARIKNAQDALQNKDNQDKIQQDIDKKKGEEEVAKAERDLRRYNDNPLTKFKLSLSGFIKKEIAPGRDKSWSRINKKYAGTGLIRPGTSRNMEKHIPAINVYFDHSGSWDESKIKVGKQAVSTLNNYVRNGDLKINLYYFSNNVHGDPESALREGGTEGQPILDHIEATKPDNVIIMTDSDITDCTTDVTVPGAVWFLFKDGRSQNLVDHLQGKRMTREFDI